MNDARLVRELLSEIADKWTVLALAACDGPGPVRFNEIKRRVGGVSPKTLTTTLRNLERNGIIARRILPGPPLGVEYLITDLGWTLAEPLTAIHTWATRHLEDVAAAQRQYDRPDGVSAADIETSSTA